MISPVRRVHPHITGVGQAHVLSGGMLMTAGKIVFRISCVAIGAAIVDEDNFQNPDSGNSLAIDRRQLSNRALRRLYEQMITLTFGQPSDQ